MLVEILKNPVIIGILAGAIVYNYMAWNRKKEIEKRLKKGKPIKESHKHNDIIIPSIIAIIVWFITFAYLNYKEEKSGQINQPNQLNQLNQLNQQMQTKINVPPIQTLNPLNSPSDIAHSITMVNKTAAVTMPPDVIV